MSWWKPSSSELYSSSYWSVKCSDLLCYGSISCFSNDQELCNLSFFSVILYKHSRCLSAVMHTTPFPVSLWGIGCCIKSFSFLLFLFLLLSLFNSSLLPSICCFHVSSKIFLPLTNFKYSLRVLSTIAYKHLEIIESQRADKKGSSDPAQWKWSNMA